MIVRLARKYGVSSVFLFGSSAVEGKEPHDIDIGVRGIEPRLFFRFCGELLMSLSKPVDVINLLHRTRFTDLVEKNGVRIYG
jgi:predicted nucleotidyltransferase